MSHISDVIGWKFNHQQGMSTVDGVITEFPGGIPSQSDQDTWTAEYEEHVAATDYQRDRVYPEIGDQLDMQYHDLVDGTTTWKDAIAKVKSDHPKP
jgi:hypothetical protein